MNKKAVRADILLLCTAAIWGFAFVAQKTGMEFLGPYTFNGIRFLIGTVSLLPLISVMRLKKKSGTAPDITFKKFFLGSLVTGMSLFIAASLQQVALIYTTAGHCGFITGLYVVLVPIAGIFLGRRTGIPTWIAAIITFIGLYFLSTEGGSFGSVNRGDALTAVSALFWTAQIMLLDRMVRDIDPVEFSAALFFWCGFFSMITALIVKEPITPEAVRGGLVPLLYGSLGSVGIAYTLQAVAQRDAPPAHAAIIMCLEGVFAAIGGFLLLHDPISGWTMAGFALMLCGMLLSQADVFKSKSR